MKRKLISDILEELEPHDIEDKVTILRENESLPLRQLLMAALDPNVKFDVVPPQYRVSRDVDGYASNSLMVESRRLYVFLAANTSVKPKRKVEILAQILESIDPKDAELLVKIINKDLSSFGLTIEIVNMAWPGLIKVPKVVAPSKAVPKAK